MADPTDLQESVFRLLANPATHGGAAVRRIDTHSASVFLAGARAYKVKRAVRFPFLDYSTLGKRKVACVAELEVNRAFAPALYRRVVPITRDPAGGLSIDGSGEPVEWAVEMVRFDENRTLDRLADAQSIDDTLASELAAAVLAMHASMPAVAVEPWLTALEGFLEQNDQAFRQAPALFAAERVDELDRGSRVALARLTPLLRSRGRIGLVRRTHGDLHLGNIVLLENRPVPFDAVEFDPLIAAGDVLYDLAFLLMDLIDRKLDRTANIVLNGYLARAQCEHLDGLAALPFFMSLRAAIRAKVTAARLERAGLTAKQDIAATAQAYFRLSLDLLNAPRPQLIAIGGLSGTGKTAVARALAPRIAPAPGALVLRSDVERKQLLGVAETDRLPADAYRPEVTAEVYRLLAEKAGRVVAAGHSAIIDAVFAKPAERAAIAAIMPDVPFHGLFLVADVNTRIRRVSARQFDASDADAAVALQQESLDLGAMEWTPIDASDSLDRTLTRLRAAIAQGIGGTASGPADPALPVSTRCS